MPPDIAAWVDESQAAFVGTLVEKRAAGRQGPFGAESVYVFEVEKWVKGEGGQMVEVHSASDGAACGFEFWTADQRIGAIIREEDGVLRGDLCSQVEPDVLLAATTPPIPSATGVGRLLIGGGWASSHLTVVDEIGHHVVGLDPPDLQPEMGGGTALDLCPDGKLLTQSIPGSVVVWETETYEPIATYSVPGGWVSDVACRNEDASSIWVVVGDDVASDLVEVVPGPEVVADLPGPVARIGSGFVVAQETHEGDAIWVDTESGSTTQLTRTPPDQLGAVSIATHPTHSLVAVVQTTFTGGEGPTTATLSVFDESGTAVQTFDIPRETYSPVWLDEHRVVVNAHDSADWERTLGLVFDIDDGTMVEIEGWNVESAVADGDRLYGVRGGSVFTTNLTDPHVETFVTLPQQSAGPLVLLENAPAVTTVTTLPTEPGSTTPPLVVSDLAGGVAENDAVGYIAWIAGGVMVAFLALLVWLGRRPSDAHRRRPI